MWLVKDCPPEDFLQVALKERGICLIEKIIWVFLGRMGDQWQCEAELLWHLWDSKLGSVRYYWY